MSADEGAAAEAPAAGRHKRSLLAPKIKRMMQADEEVGKIGGNTPLVLGKAMELFLQTLLSRAVAVAQKRKAKTLTGAHLKACLVGDDTFDFLKSVVAAAPDLAPVSEEASGEGGEVEEDAPPKRKPKPRAPKAKAPPGDGQDAAAPPAKRVRKAAATKAPRAPKPSKPTMDSDWESDQEGPAAPGPPGGATSAPQPQLAVAEAPAEVPLSFAAVDGGAAVQEEEDYDA